MDDSMATDADPASEGWEQLMGSDLMLKKVVTKEDECPVNHQDAVLVDFVGRLCNDRRDVSSDGEVFQTAKDWLLVVGEKDVLPALEMGIRFLRQGETALVWSHSKFGYGIGIRKEGDRVVVPPNSNICYEITVQKVIDEDTARSRSFQVDLCLSKKKIANDIYKNEDITSNEYARGRAIRMYRRAAEMLEYMLQQRNDENDNNQVEDKYDRIKARECMLDCFNNIAAVHLQCRDYHAAKEACVLTLTHDSNNLTALIRAAKASLLDPASTYSEVQAALDAADEQCETQQQRDQVQSLREKYQRKLKVHKIKEKRMYSKMAQAAVVDKPKESSIVDKETSIPSSKSDKDDKKRKDKFSLLMFLRNVNWKRILNVYVLQLLIPVCIFWWLQGRQALNMVPNQQKEV